MKHLTTLSFILLLLVAVAYAGEPAASPEADTPKGDSPEAAKPKDGGDVNNIDWGKAEEKVNDVGLRDDYLKLAEITDATPEQQKQLLEDQEQRAKALEKWDQQNAKRIERYEKAIAHERNEKRRETYKEGLARLMSKREDVALEHLAKSLKSLKPEQQQKYMGYRLWKAIEPAFDELNVQLDEAQEQEALKICTEVAGKTRGDAASSPRLKKEAYNLVGRNVLTDQQKHTAEQTAMAAQRREEERKRREREREKEKEEEEEEEEEEEGR
jgi:hypothetical protein